MPARVPYRILAACFGFVGAVGIVSAFVVSHGRYFSAFMFYGMLYAVTAAGLWQRAGWGRMLGLVATVANAGLGVLAVISSLSAGRSPIGPAVFTLMNATAAFLLARGQLQAGAR